MSPWIWLAAGLFLIWYVLGIVIGSRLQRPEWPEYPVKLHREDRG